MKSINIAIERMITNHKGNILNQNKSNPSLRVLLRPVLLIKIKEPLMQVAKKQQEYKDSNIKRILQRLRSINRKVQR